METNYATLLADAEEAGLRQDAVLQFADVGPVGARALRTVMDDPDLIRQMNDAYVAITRIVREFNQRRGI